MKTYINKYYFLIKTVSLVIGVSGLLVVFGWLLDVDILKSILPGKISMKFNTALCFIGISIGLFIYVSTENKFYHQLSKVFFFIVLVFAILTLSQSAFNYNLGLDQVFYFDKDSIPTNLNFPGRMATITSICFVLLSVTFLVIRSANQIVLRLTQAFLHITTFLSFIAILAYIFNASKFYKLSFLSAMPFYSSFAVFLFSLAASLLNPTVLITGFFTGDKVGNVFARKLFLRILIASIVLTGLCYWTNKYWMLNVGYEIFLFATSAILACMFLIMAVASQINRIEIEKNVAEADLTKLKILEESEKKYSKILEYKNTQLVDFCNIISHNLRAPLVNISMLVDYIEQSESEEERKEVLAKIKPVVAHLNELFNELVESVQVRQDTEIKSDTIILKDYLSKVLRGFESQIKAYQAEITFDFSAAPNILYPHNYIESILTNLVSNALKYKSPKRNPILHIKTEIVKGQIILSVSDNGLGIDMNLAKGKLFKIRKVFHIHPDAKGFGLFITKSHVEAMGGRIWVESVVDKGSTFFVEFNINLNEK
jgi:signal transduction histidine kinase